MSDFITSLRNTFQGRNHRWWALSAVECGNFLAYMDAFIVTLALPAIARQFSVGLHEVKWVMLAYLISLTISLMLAGRLGDRFGRKLLTQAGLVTLVVGAALCLVATSLEVLIACRGLQGAGAAMVLANVMAEITALFPKAERRRAMACNTSVLAAGQVVGLLAGGALIDSWGWRSVFAVIAGIGCIGLVLGTIILRNRPAENPAPFDLHGAWLSLLVVGLPFLLIERISSGLSSVTAMLYLTGSLVLLAIFILVERNHPAPPAESPALSPPGFCLWLMRGRGVFRSRRIKLLSLTALRADRHGVLSIRGGLAHAAPISRADGGEPVHGGALQIH